MDCCLTAREFIGGDALHLQFIGVSRSTILCLISGRMRDRETMDGVCGPVDENRLFEVAVGPSATCFLGI